VKKAVIISFVIVVLFGIFLEFMPKKVTDQYQVPRGGEFTLVGHDGPFSLSSVKSKYAIVYFGYTFCPDICPTTLNNLSHALNKLTPEEKKQFTVIFISVDPQRDTQARLKTYVEFFGKNIVALTGTEKKLKEIADQYGVKYERHIPEDGGDDYSVDHSTEAFLVNKKGEVLELIPHGMIQKNLIDLFKRNL